MFWFDLTHDIQTEVAFDAFNDDCHGGHLEYWNRTLLLIDLSLTVNAATLIFIPGCGSAISSAREGKSVSLYNLVKN